MVAGLWGKWLLESYKIHPGRTWKLWKPEITEWNKSRRSQDLQVSLPSGEGRLSSEDSQAGRVSAKLISTDTASLSSWSLSLLSSARRSFREACTVVFHWRKNHYILSNPQSPHCYGMMSSCEGSYCLNYTDLQGSKTCACPSICTLQIPYHTGKETVVS